MASTKSATARWARWQWSHGMGRWHRLFADGDLTKTACSSPRKSHSHVAATTAATPSDGNPICPVCKSLDDLLQKVMTGKLTDAIATTTVPVLTPEPVLAQGICGCGCVKSDEYVSWKREHDEWLANESTRKAAEFEAYLASRAVAA